MKSFIDCENVDMHELSVFISEIPLHERLLLETKGNLVYSGTFKEKYTKSSVDGIFIQLDEKSGLSIWCPLQHIKSLRLIFVE